MRSKFAKRSFSDGTFKRLDRFGARPSSDLEDSALVGDVDWAAEALLGLAARPELVHLVGHVGQQHTLDAGGAGVLARLARREVAPLARALGARQRGLDDHQVGAAREL